MRFARRHFWGTALILLATLAGSAFASDWAAPATEFAKQVVKIAGASPVTLTVRNESALSSGDVDAIRHELEELTSNYTPHATQ